MRSDRVGLYDDIASTYNGAIYFDQFVDSPFVSSTNQFLINFVNYYDIATLTDLLLNRIQRRVKAMIPVGTLFGGFGYRIQYINNDKISMTDSDYDDAKLMSVGTRMSGMVAYDGTGSYKNRLVGTGTLFTTEINVDDYIVIGFDNDFVRIAKVLGIDSDGTLYLVDDLPLTGPKSTGTGLSIAKYSYSKLVSKYQAGSGANIKYYIRSYIPSNEYPDSASYDWPYGAEPKVAIGDVTCVGVVPNYEFDLTTEVITPPFPDTHFYVDGFFMQSLSHPVVKLDKLTFFVLFEIHKI
jgi:hypothetical protein